MTTPTLPIVAPSSDSRQDLAVEPRYFMQFDEAKQSFKIIGPTGQACLSITLGPHGPVIEFGGSGLEVRSAGALAFTGQQVEITGREGVVIRSGKDALLDIAGNLCLAADAHRIVADRGNVDVEANDDVKLIGERIRMNC
jgi:hypothetical protein